MDNTTGSNTGNDPRNGFNGGLRGIFPGRATTWLALAALLISVGHVAYAIWRDHFNGGEGVLNL